MSLTPWGKVLVKTTKNNTCPVGREERPTKRSAEKKQKANAERCSSAQSFVKKHTTKPSRAVKRRAQAVVVNFHAFCTYENPQLFQKKRMFPLDKDGKQPMMWQKVVRSGW